MRLGKKNTLLLALLFTIPGISHGFGGNTSNDSFNRAKKNLENRVYKNLSKQTIYCDASFSGNSVTNANGFSSSKYASRATKLEWEHIVPAENFGKAFLEWRKGHPECVTASGKTFKGRNCASKVNKTFRFMLADMYNLYPSIGAVNAMRSNYSFAEGVTADQQLGKCTMKISISRRKAEPPSAVKGAIARTYLYMDKTYSQYRTGQRRLFNAWNNKYPVTEDECKRTKRIEAIQHNSNPLVKTPCMRAGIWP